MAIGGGGGGGGGLACKAKEAVCNEANSHNHYQEHSIPCINGIGSSLSQKQKQSVATEVRKPTQ